MNRRCQLPVTLTALGLLWSLDVCAAATEPVLAVWKAHTLSFRYAGDSTFYSCEWLQNRVQSILVAVGARVDPVVQIQHCAEGRNGFSELIVQLTAPVIAEDSTLQEMTDYNSREQLVAKVRREQLPSAAELTRFWAQWRRVNLTRNLRLDSGDCELLRQLGDQLFAALNVRIIENKEQCLNPLATYLPGRFVVEALVPVPIKKPRPARPAAAD